MEKNLILLRFIFYLNNLKITEFISERHNPGPGSYEP